MNYAQWHFDSGFVVFPLKPRTKEPACRSWDDYTCEREAVTGWPSYGVGLRGWLVVDTDDTPAEQLAAASMPDTPFRVKTARGMHRYYRLVGTKKYPIDSVPHFIHRDGLTIEARHGQGHYVVGAGSVHPSGAIYRVADWSWNVHDVPFFPVDDIEWDDRPREVRGSIAGEPYRFPEVVRAGERHDQLFRLLRSMKGSGVDRESTRDVVHEANVHRCDPPLAENRDFERWFERQWNKPDRPFAPRDSCAEVAGYDSRTLRRLGLRL